MALGRCLLLASFITHGHAQPREQQQHNQQQPPPQHGQDGQPPPQMRNCPEEPFEAPRSELPQGKPVEVEVSFMNGAGTEVEVFLVNNEGGENFRAVLPPGEAVDLKSIEGMLYHFRSKKTKKLIDGFLTKPPPAHARSLINPCIGVDDHYVFDEPRWPVYDSLVTPWTECEGSGPMDAWSCRRHISAEEVDKRDSSLYGWAEGEIQKDSPHKVKTWQVHDQVQQLVYMPNVTNFEGGYLKMKMPPAIAEVVRYYKENQAKIRHHEPTPGFVMNNHVVDMDMLFIPQELKRSMVDELTHVMEWWTKTRMKHTTTYDIRVYRKGAMLINHIDRKNTHLTSAILQVAQTCDKDFGWPLEMLHPHQSGVKEVFLQPGEMLLYEGARLPHGRPMRSKCQEFANVFTHFVPVDFHSANEQWRNPHLDPDWKAPKGPSTGRDEL